MTDFKLHKVSSLILLCGALVAGLSVNVSGKYIQLAIAGLAGLWLLQVVWLWVAHRRLPLKIDSVLIFSLLTVTWSAISLFWSESDRALGGFLIQTALIGVFVIMRDSIENSTDLHIVSNGFLLGIAVCVARLAFGDVSWTDYGPVMRASLEAFNPNYLGYAFAGAIAVNVALYASTPEGLKWFRWLSVGVSIVGIFLTGTRGAQMAVLILVVWLILSRLMTSPPIRTLLWSVAIGAVAMSIGVIDFLLKLLDYGDRSTGDLSGRFGIWQTARDMWFDNFFTGSGMLGTVEELGVHAHNVILEAGANAGLIGLVLLLTLFVVALKPRPGTNLTNQGKIILGSFLTVSVPIYLSGTWEWALTGWIILALFSRAIQLNTSDINVAPVD